MAGRNPIGLASPPVRVAIYARVSDTDLQRKKSVSDQHEMGRRYIARQQGWSLVGTYDDVGISGENPLRPGFLRMLADAKAGRFDVLVIESIDRLGRKLGDVARAFDLLDSGRIQVHATSFGQVTQMHVGIIGTMAQLMMVDLRVKTKRGQLGRAREGRIPGGLAFGYDVVEPAPGDTGAGKRSINEKEAEVVRRIFREYVAGKSPRRIAHDLNAANVPGPGDKRWNDTTIRGQSERGNGILNNSLYVGRLSWNRCSYVKDPTTGKRQARPNPVDEWETIEVSRVADP